MPAKQSLKKEEKDRKFRLLFEDNPQPMWVFDAQSLKFLEVNSAASALYGFSPAEFRSLDLVAILGAEDARRFAGELSSGKRPITGVWKHRTRSNCCLDVEMAVHDIQFGGRPAELAVLIDITGRRQLEEQLRQAQKMEAVGMLAGGVAHDFNNLLTIITGYSQLMLTSLPSEDANRYPVEQIMKAGERAAALTKQLLAFSRRQVVQPRVFDLNKLVTSLGTMLQRLIGEDVDLRLALGAEMGSVNADPGQIEQVLMNLVINSRDAMPQGGTLTIETQMVVLDESYTSRHLEARPGSHILLAVSDTGAGMDEFTKAHLFEPFFTTKAAGRGTGLGLSTVFGIVRQSGGSVNVYSELGLGTSVKVYLPSVDQPVAAESESRKAGVKRGTETVLLVEDDEAVRALVRQALLRDGYKVLDSADPLEAQRISAEYRGRIQLLITDVVMPKVSGRELAERISQLRPNMKILYMSGYTDGAVLNSGILEEEVAFLQKPFTPDALTAKVREVLESANNKILRAGE
jgi:PAS domain S-box-containing protein